MPRQQHWMIVAAPFFRSHMARFMSSALVQKAGIQWMVNADKHGAGSWQCLLLDHIYKTALDKV